jgi:hypothetical protein
MDFLPPTLTDDNFSSIRRCSEGRLMDMSAHYLWECSFSFFDSLFTVIASAQYACVALIMCNWRPAHGRRPRDHRPYGAENDATIIIMVSVPLRLSFTARRIYEFQ